MTTDPITGGTSSLTPNSKATQAGLGLAEDFDNFLKLLTIQLQNQDPTDPMDTNEFTRQIVDFTGVEQAVATNTNLEKLIELFSGNQINASLGYIDREVEFEGNTNTLKDGRAQFDYDLEAPAGYMAITILDSTGREVFTKYLESASVTPEERALLQTGRQSFIWDGKNARDEQLPDGEYSIKIEATTPRGDETVNTTTYSIGDVSEVRFNGNKTILYVGNRQVDQEDIIAIRSKGVLPTVLSSEEES